MKSLSQYWRKLSITAKFSSAFALLLALIVLVAITAYAALTLVQNETESAILTSAEIRRMVLEMDGGLENARRLHRDFFLSYPEIGFENARERYAQQSIRKIAEVVALSEELKKLITKSEVTDALRKRNVDLNLYLSSAKRFSDTFSESVELVTILAASETGLQAQLDQNSDLLQDILKSAEDRNLTELYRDMQFFEREYRITRQRPFMQSAFNVAFQLRKAIEKTPAIESDQKVHALTYLRSYVRIGGEILETDSEIRSKFNDFTLQAKAVDPISAELVALAETEVDHARDHIKQTSQFATAVLAVAALAGLLMVMIIAKVLNSSITHNVLRLTESACELQAGSLDVKAHINSGDELGQLAGSFNDMANRIRDLVGNLEHKVEERTADLAKANEEITKLNEQLKEENLRMGAELDVARRLQQMVLPTTEELKNIDGLEIAGFMEPADEVGGDYYDVLRHEGNIKIGIGDVTGHGLESGVLMMMLQTAVRTLLVNGETDPVRFMSTLNRIIYDNVQRMNLDKSLTLALLDYKNGQVKLSGQHEEMIVVRRDGRTERVDTIDLGFPLGLDDNIADFVSETTVSLERGDGVVLYSDGFTEAENDKGDFYGLDRLCDVISLNWRKSAEEIKLAVVKDVRQYIGGATVYDDLTLVVLKQQ